MLDTPWIKGQAEQVTTTFGGDWPHLVVRIVIFALVCTLAYLCGYLIRVRP
jgi:hypothetical protein